MWDAKRNAVSTFLATPRINADSAWMSGRRAVMGTSTLLRTTTLDDLVMNRASQDLQGLIDAGLRAMVCLPLHFDSLASAATRYQFVDRIRSFSDEVRKYLVIELVGLPDGIPLTRLSDVIAGLKQNARAVIAQCPVQHRQFGTFRDAGLKVCGVEMIGRPSDETRSIELLSRFAANAERAGMQSYLHGTPSSSIVVAALAAGFTYISGAPIGAAVEDLKAVERYTLSDFFHQVSRHDSA